MRKTKVEIYGRKYTVNSEYDERYIDHLCGYVNGKIRELVLKNQRLDYADACALCLMNVADDYVSEQKAKSHALTENEQLSKSYKELHERLKKAELAVNELSKKNNKLEDDVRRKDNEIVKLRLSLEKTYDVNSNEDLKTNNKGNDEKERWWILIKTEILSPAGGIEEFYAAINSGADAVYTGLKLYSARKNAKNLEIGELREITSYAHLIGKKVYLALNTMLFNEEIEDLISSLPEIFSCNPDGIIVQDIGLFSVLRKYSKGVELHASTQMTADNFYAVKNLKTYGFDRVVVSREMSIDEIALIKKDLKVDIEAFVHGALCVCYSGECYFSSTIGERSANRGDCAQPCRKRYNLIVDNKPVGKNGFYLSMKDLNTSHYIKAIAQHVDSLKIEGRMKNKEYVATVTSFYYKKLHDEMTTDSQEKELADAFSRGFTKGFILEEDKQSMINSVSPKHIGSLVGKVIDSKNNKSYIKLDSPLYNDDGITFIDKSGKSDGEKITRFFKEGSILEINKSLLIGENVYRNYSSKIYDKNKNISEKTKLPIDMYLHSKIGEPLKLKIAYQNRNVEVLSNFIVEKSNSCSDSRDIIKKQLDRIGDTFFYLDKFEFFGDRDIFVPKSILNDMRREGIEKILEDSKAEFVFKGDKRYFKKNKKREPKISLLVDSVVSECVLKDVFEIRLDYDNTNLEKLFNLYRERNFEPCLVTPSILTMEEVLEIKDLIKQLSVKKVVVNNFALMDLECEIVVGSSLNVSNVYAVDFYKMHGVREFIPSREMTIGEIGTAFNETMLRLPYYTNTVSMITKTIGNDVIDAIDKGGTVKLEDAKNEMFPVKYIRGKYYIYNSKPMFMARTMDRIDADIIEITYDENYNQIIDFFNGSIKDVDFSYTTGHYNRGVARWERKL